MFSKITKVLFNTGGKGSFNMEKWKFGIYIIFPIGASIYYGNPIRMKESAEYWKFIEYPPNPNVGLKDDILRAQKQTQQHEAYRKQLEELHERNTPRAVDEEDTNKPGFWRRLVGLGKGE